MWLLYVVPVAIPDALAPAERRPIWIQESKTLGWMGEGKENVAVRKGLRSQVGQPARRTPNEGGAGERAG